MTITICSGLIYTRLDGQDSTLKKYHGIFFKGRETSEDIPWRLFLMNMKGYHVPASLY
jgi:hypothetical protein